MFREAIDLYSKVLAPDHQNIAIARIKLGRTLVRERQFTEAEGFLKAGYDVLARQMDPSARWVQSARAELVTVYEALGRPEQAARYRTPAQTGSAK